MPEVIWDPNHPPPPLPPPAPGPSVTPGEAIPVESGGEFVQQGTAPRVVSEGVVQGSGQTASRPYASTAIGLAAGGPAGAFLPLHADKLNRDASAAKTAADLKARAEQAGEIPPATGENIFSQPWPGSMPGSAPGPSGPVMVDPGGIKHSGTTITQENGVNVPDSTQAYLVGAHIQDNRAVDVLARAEIAERAAKEEASAMYAAQAADARRVRRENEMSRQRDIRSQMVQMQKAMFDMNQKVDPERFWKSRTTGQKVFSLLGIAIGGLGGSDAAFNYIQGAVQSDIQAQMADIQTAQGRGQLAHSTMAAYRQMFGDEEAAEKAMEAQIYSSMESYMDRLMGSVKDASTLARATQVKAKLNRSMYESLIGLAKLQHGKRTVQKQYTRYAPQYAGGGGAGKKKEEKGPEDPKTLDYSKAIIPYADTVRGLSYVESVMSKNPGYDDSLAKRKAIAAGMSPYTSDETKWALEKLGYGEQVKIGQDTVNALVPVYTERQGSNKTEIEVRGEIARVAGTKGHGEMIRTEKERALQAEQILTQGLPTAHRQAHSRRGGEIGIAPTSEATKDVAPAPRRGEKIR